MAATSAEPAGQGEGWVFEEKLDGYRCLATVVDGEVRLRSRNHKPFDDAFPEVVEAVRAGVSGDALLDGEVVALDEQGRPSFNRLQRRVGLRSRPASGAEALPVRYVVFDVLWADGLDLRELTLTQRQAVLRQIVSLGEVLVAPTAIPGPAADALAAACERGWEGVIAKRESATYQARRSRDWLKLKCLRAQEMVVLGHTEPQGQRTGLGALLVGYHDADGALRYAGKVGTGFDRATLTRLRALLDTIATDEALVDDPAIERGVRWVEPLMVVQVGFGEWTPDGHIRHPRFLGFRPDKAAADVVREP